MARVLPSLITITDAAAERVKSLLDARGAQSAGVRLSVKTKGCSGMAYDVQYVDAPDPRDEKIEAKGVTVYIDPKATLFIIGSEMDYKEDKFQSGFTFSNPNEKGRCGCGESFTV